MKQQYISSKAMDTDMYSEYCWETRILAPLQTETDLLNRIEAEWQFSQLSDVMKGQTGNHAQLIVIQIQLHQIAETFESMPFNDVDLALTEYNFLQVH